LKIYISQGIVATQLRGGDRFSNHFITNFPQIVPINIWRRYGLNFAAYFFDPPCIRSKSDHLTNKLDWNRYRTSKWCHLYTRV